MEYHDLVIIGGGSAGMAAAVSAYDKGIRDILILERNEMLGGILNQCIHNGFGLHEFKEELTGPEFLTRFVKQVEERKIPYWLDANVTHISKEKVLTILCPKGAKEIQAKAIIMAAGCYERNAGAIGIPGDRPAGSGSTLFKRIRLFGRQEGFHPRFGRYWPYYGSTHDVRRSKSPWCR